MQKTIKFASELDLWNLDEGAEPLQLENTRMDVRRATVLPPAPVIPAEISEVDESEETELEKDPEPEPEQPQVSPVTPKRKDTPVKSANVRHSEPKKLDLPQILQKEEVVVNNDLWDELDEQNPSTDELEPAPTLRVIAESTEDSEPVLVQEPVSEPVPTVELEPVVASKSKPVATELSNAPQSDATQVVPAGKQPTTHEQVPKEFVKDKDKKADEPATLEPKPKKTSFIGSLTNLEKIAILAFFALFVALSVAATFYFKSNVEEQKDPYARPNFPVQGRYVTVENMDSYWREPIRSGKDADPVQLKVISIAEVRITLPKSIPPTGALRVKFYDGQGNAIGDTVTKALNTGSFQTDFEAKFACTAGFNSPEEMDSYRANVSKPWRVEVFEASRYDAPLSEYALLFSAPISTTQK